MPILVVIFFNQEVEHSIANLPRPVRIKKAAFRSHQYLRTSVMFKVPVKNGVDCQDSVETSGGSAKHVHKHNSEINGASARSQEKKRQGDAPLYEILLCNISHGLHYGFYTYFCPIWL